MRLLVTGAQGFTGQHFMQYAKNYGYEPVALNSSLEHVEQLRQEIAQVKPDKVVHLAAISFVGEKNLSQFYNINVVGTTNLLDALLQLKVPPRQIMLVSSATVYGNSTQSPITEEAIPIPLNHYAMSKLAMEYMAKTYLSRLPIFFVRPFNYIGPGQSESFIIPKLLYHFITQADRIEMGNYNVEREFNDVRFVCEAYCRLLNKAQIGEIYNICSGMPVPLSTVIGLLSELTEHQLQIVINQKFVRDNEIQRLCGSPNKLFSLVGEMPSFTLENTLNWMIEQSKVKVS